MDSLTHIAIGACIGELFLGKEIGKKAMLYGAVAASLPDMDFIAGFWLNTTEDLLAHRGITHSILFAILITWLLARFLKGRHKEANCSLQKWILFLGVEIFFHLFIDALNAYGIGWFEPFSHQRVSFHIIFVADPFYSVWPGITAFVLLLINRHHPGRIQWARMGLVLSSLYLVYCMTNKFRIDQAVKSQLIHQGISQQRYFTTPTSFNNWLWYVVAETDSGYNIGYRSVFDKKSFIDFHYYNRNARLLKPFRELKDIEQLISFSQGYYQIEMSKEGLLFNDLRFGQINGWLDPDAPFVFHYYLQQPGANRMVVQRGRFEHSDWPTVKAFLRRVGGN